MAQLRKKFILMTMSALLLILVVIIGAANLINYHSVTETADETLALLRENGGTFESFSLRQEEQAQAPEGRTGEGQNGGGRRRGGEPFSPELPYETRYFSVTYDARGEVAAVDLSRIAAVDEQQALLYAEQVSRKDVSSGFVDDYRYLVVSREDGGLLLLFLDCGKNLDSFRNFLLASCAISVAGWLVVLILMLFVSGRLIKPVADSYVKQRQFITDAGHELKTPLTIIRADADLIEMEQGSSEWTRDIRTQTTRLTELTDQLVYLSRMEEDDRGFAMVPLDYSALVQETAASFQSVSRTTGRSLVINVEPHLTVNGEEKALRQMVSILMDNALKYSDGEGPIRLTLLAQGRFALLELSNPAKELGQEELERLFDRFYRADRSRSSSAGGHGIGLSVARAVAAQHRGRIWASSAEGRLTITVQLPLVRSQDRLGIAAAVRRR